MDSLRGCFQGVLRHLPSGHATLVPDAHLPQGAWEAAAELPVLPQVRREVAALLARKEMFRAGYTDGDSPAVLCEKMIAEYMGFKYCVAVNSHSSALFVALVAAGVRSGTRVLASALACATATSAICQAGGDLVLVESHGDLSIDVRDLASKAEQTGARYLVLSHLHCSALDADGVVQECNARGIVIIEDCADSLGSWYDGRHIGHHGFVCCVSAQPNAVIHCGDGGFAATDDVGLAACMAALAGSYSAEFKAHFAAPESAVFGAIDQGAYPCYSLQMSNVMAAVLRWELGSVELRVGEANKRHQRLAVRFAALLEVAGELRSALDVEVPQVPQRARPCLNSFGFSAALGPRALAAALAAARRRGVPLQCLADVGGARSLSMDVEPGPDAAEAGRCVALLARRLFVRLPPRLPRRQVARAADVLVLALREAAEVALEEGPAPLPPAAACAVVRRLGVRRPRGGGAAEDPELGGPSPPRTPLSGAAEPQEASPCELLRLPRAGAEGAWGPPGLAAARGTPTSASASATPSPLPPSAHAAASPSSSPQVVEINGTCGLPQEMECAFHMAESLNFPQGPSVSVGAHSGSQSPASPARRRGSPVSSPMQRVAQDVDLSGTRLPMSLGASVAAIPEAAAVVTPVSNQALQMLGGQEQLSVAFSSGAATPVGDGLASGTGAGAWLQSPGPWAPQGLNMLTPSSPGVMKERLTARVCPSWAVQKGGSHSVSPASSIPQTPLVQTNSFGGISEGKVSAALSALVNEAGAKLGEQSTTSAMMSGSVSVLGSAPASVAGSIVTAPRYTQTKVLAAGPPAVGSASRKPAVVMRIPQSATQLPNRLSVPAQKSLGATRASGVPAQARGVKPLAASRITSA